MKRKEFQLRENSVKLAVHGLRVETQIGVKIFVVVDPGDENEFSRDGTDTLRRNTDVSYKLKCRFVATRDTSCWGVISYKAITNLAGRYLL